MVGVSYHELNAGTKRTERHSAAERKQFLVVCVVGAAFLFNAFINAGLFESVDITDDGIFPGGVFVHNLVEHRDYASTGGFWREIRENLQPDTSDIDDSVFDDDIYAVYIDFDSPFGGVGRFFTGVLIDESKTYMKERLLEKNISAKTKDDADTLYEVGDLPSVRCVTATFPWTDGFVSALLHNYKVFPALYKYAKNNLPEDHKLIVTITCNRERQMCTHYIPMIKSKNFLLGNPDTHEYPGREDDQISLNPEKIWNGLQKLMGKV